MRKKMIGALAVCAVLGAVAVPANAEASTYCGIGKLDSNRSGYSISYKGARANGMNCASVRYALQPVPGQDPPPVRLAASWRAPFFDGWVTWQLLEDQPATASSCWEGTSDTSYSFQAYVW